jgi:hypothetical protein
MKIGGVWGTYFRLEIDYTVRYSTRTRNGCLLSQIPTPSLAAEDSPILQPQNFCVTLQQHTMRFVVKFSALAAILLATAVLSPWLGYWDFRGWRTVPGGVECPGMVPGNVSVEFDGLQLLGAMPFLLQRDYGATPLSDLDDIGG